MIYAGKCQWKIFTFLSFCCYRDWYRHRRSWDQHLTAKKIRQEKGSSKHSKCQFVANPCPHYSSTAHGSSRSPDCTAYKPSTGTMLKDALGSDLERFCRKCSLDGGGEFESRFSILSVKVSLPWRSTSDQWWWDLKFLSTTIFMTQQGPVKQA